MQTLFRDRHTFCAAMFLVLMIPGQSCADVSGDLFHSINQRLSLMPSVALFKARNTMPIEDLEREQLVLAASKLEAAAAGLNAESVAMFFQAQIAAAKAIQFRYRADLLGQQAVQESFLDLNTEIRPQLDALGDQIVRLLSLKLSSEGVFTEADRPAFEASMTTEYLAAQDKQLLFDSLLQVRATTDNQSND